jgi:hypothetical protein
MGMKGHAKLGSALACPAEDQHQRHTMPAHSSSKPGGRPAPTNLQLSLFELICEIRGAGEVEWPLSNLLPNGQRGTMHVFSLLLTANLLPNFTFVDPSPATSKQLQSLMIIFYAVCEKYVLGGGIACSNLLDGGRPR